MKNQQTGLLLLLAVVIAIVLGALAYFLVISPELDKGTAARESAVAAADQNDLLEIQIAQMQALEQQVPDWREDIARIALDLPALPEQSAIITLVQEQLDAAGIPAVDITVGLPTLIDPLGTGSAGLPTLEESDEGEGEAATSATPSPEPSATATTGTENTEPQESTTAPFTGLYGIPVSFTTEGDPESVLAVMNSMSEQLQRFFTVSGLNVATAEPTEEGAGRPALTNEDWTSTVSGLVFTLWSDDRSIVVDEEGELPVYQGGSTTNPFAPLPGTEPAED